MTVDATDSTAMCSTWFIRFPARGSRWRICSPQDASTDAVPGPGGEPVAVGEHGEIADIASTAVTPKRPLDAS
jgi:hypothetical protein